MVQTMIILIVLIVLSYIIHFCLVGKYLYLPHFGSWIDVGRSESWDRLVDPKRVFLTTASLFVTPVLYNFLKDFHSSNDVVNIICLSLILLISVFLAWFNKSAILKKDFLSDYLEKLEVVIDSSVVDIRLDVPKTEKDDGIKRFESFIKNLRDFKYLNFEERKFDLKRFLISKEESKPVKTISPLQCRYLLIVFFFEEIYGSSEYLNKIDSSYLEVLNNYLENPNVKISKHNFSKFRKSYNLSEGGIEYQKKSDFYMSLLEFYNKNYTA